MAVGPYAVSNYYMEAKRGQRQAMLNSKEVILQVGKEFEKISGRSYGLFENYKLDDADYAIVIIGSAAGTAKDAVDAMRKQGKKVGLLKIRVFRPFPSEEIVKALSKVKSVGIMDRSECFNGNGGPLSDEIGAALYRYKSKVEVVNYVYGLGGRDITVNEFEDIFNELEDVVINSKEVEQFKYVGLRD